MFAKFKEMLATIQVSISFHEILELMPKFTKIMKTLLKGKGNKRESGQGTSKDD